MTSDLVTHRYLVALSNFTFTADITFLAPDIQLILFLDLGTRRIAAYQLEKGAIVTKDVIELILGIEKHIPLRDVVIFHFDCQSIFKSKALLEFMKQKNFYLSNGLSLHHRNQCSEVLNKTIKRILRRKMAEVLGVQEKPYLKQEKFAALVKRVGWEGLRSLLKEAIAEYNTKPHCGKRMYGASPNIMDAALASIDRKVVVPDQIISKNDNSKIAKRIGEFKAEALENYIANLQNFFISWRLEQEANHQEIKAISLDLKKQNNKLRKDLDEVLRINKEMQQRLYEQDQKEKDKLLAKEKRKNRKILSKRESISPSEYYTIMEICQTFFKNNFIRARVRVAITLLYLTGLRVSNLLLITKKQMSDLLQNGEITLRIIKRGKENQLICIGNEGRKLLNELADDIGTLGQGQTEDLGPFFFSPLDPSKPINKFNFDKQINKVLKNYSARTQKYIRTHSFRATFINDLLNQDHPIEKVKDVIGHKNITTTEIYRRSNVPQKELRKIINHIQRSRLKGARIFERILKIYSFIMVSNSASLLRLKYSQTIFFYRRLLTYLFFPTQSAYLSLKNLEKRCEACLKIIF